MVGSTLAALALGAPASAAAAGCEVVREPAERAECAVRAQARSEARAEVDRRVEDAPRASGVSDEQHSPAWGDALAEAGGFDVQEAVEPRPLAAVVGLAWFALAVRMRWRQRARARTR